MSEGVNQWVGAGNLAANPLEPQGNGPCVLRLAIGRNTFDREGKLTELTDYMSINVWGKRGEALAKILRKGEPVTVTGFLSTHSWEDKDGKRQYALTVTATNVVLRGKKQ
jgi:single-strand DNA-binding protein